MLRVFAVVTVVSLLAVSARAEDAEIFQAPKRGGFDLDGMARHEWTRSIFVSPDETRNEDRWRFRLLPRLTLGGERLNLAAGGDFNYSTDENVKPKPTLLRDNYNSRSARLDLAFGHVQPFHWIKLEAGRTVMPIGFTEMIWDKDLRPQGGWAKLMTHGEGGGERLSLTGVFSQGGHVFDDGNARLMAGSAQARLKAGLDSRLDLIASYLQFSRLEDLEPMIRRQNTRDADGLLATKFRVVDFVTRLRVGGRTPMQFVADYAWNTAESDQNRGVWLATVLGNLKDSRATLEYSYARVDRNVTVAAFTTDDFFWGTGWEGHRVDLGTRTKERISTHVIGQLQRFKDSARVEEQEHWVQRLRVEIRLTP
jgi:hypothetical protein